MKFRLYRWAARRENARLRRERDEAREKARIAQLRVMAPKNLAAYEREIKRPLMEEISRLEGKIEMLNARMAVMEQERIDGLVYHYSPPR
jgi:hypothetical protein